MRFRDPSFLLAGTLLLGAFGSGCSQQTLNGMKHDTDRNVAAVTQAGHEAERAARPQIDKLNTGARVRAALLANTNLPSSIRVDASSDGVRLRGHVKTRAQKALAGRIARETLSSDKSVDNQLDVTGN